MRDFTSDPAIAKDLTKPFGTFEAFIEKLDYLKDLGVTHIQLLPVLSYYFVNELKTMNAYLTMLQATATTTGDMTLKTTSP